jgi:hypothetical protein
LARRWSKQLELVGAAGEAVDLRRTRASHDVANLPRINEEAWTLTTTLALARRATTLHIAPVPSGWARPTLEKAQPTP